MKQKVAAHLSMLFPQIRGVGFDNLKILGQASVEAMSRKLKPIHENLLTNIDKQEKLLEELNGKRLWNVMETVEIASYIAYLRIKIGNRKLAISNLNTIISNMKASYLRPNYPIMPCLRDSSHFLPGDDVMFYTGEVELDGQEKAPSEGVRTTSFRWVAAKVINCSDQSDEFPLRVFTVNHWLQGGSMQGHFGECLVTSPFVFKRSEFFKIRKMLETNSDPEFLLLFLNNFEVKAERYKIIPCNDTEQIREMILDSNIERISVESLKENEETMLLLAYEIATQERIWTTGVRAMAERLEIELPLD